jgi:hypothetical protein
VPDVERRHAHEEDGRARRVDVLVHPARPRRQHPPVRLAPHQLVVILPALPARSPAKRIQQADKISVAFRAFVRSARGLRTAAASRARRIKHMQHAHDFHVERVHPPDVRVEDQVVDAAPVLGVLRDLLRLDDPVLDAVDLGVVRVGLHQERRPVELNRRVELLHAPSIQPQASGVGFQGKKKVSGVGVFFLKKGYSLRLFFICV